MKATRIIHLIAIFFLLSTAASAQTTWIVDPGGGADFTAIQDCIDAASVGDTCQVKAGTYVETIDFIGKDLTVVSTSGSDVTIIDGNDAGSVVTFENGETEAAVLDGFTVQNGQSTVADGAGVYCYNSSPNITNCTIRENDFWYNSGGGIYGNSSAPTVTHCHITGNVAGVGGGLFFYDSSPVITNCTIQRNDGFAFEGGGAGLHCVDSNLTITDCTVTDNYASGFGGGIKISGGTTTITGCDISNNTAYMGCGIYCGYASLVLSNSTLDGNVALGEEGGGILAGLSTLLIKNCTFRGNSASWGGGIACVNTTSTIVNSTLGQNTADLGGGIYLYAGEATITNSILWGDSAPAGYGPEIYLGASGSLITTYSDVEGGEADVKVGTGSTLNWGSGMINLNPQFAGTDDFHLKAISPCIDRGDNAAPGLPSTDLDGNPRVVDGDNDSVAVVDMGAYEFQPAPAWAASSTVAADSQHVRTLRRSHGISFVFSLGILLGALLLLRRYGQP